MLQHAQPILLQELPQAGRSRRFLPANNQSLPNTPNLRRKHLPPFKKSPFSTYKPLINQNTNTVPRRCRHLPKHRKELHLRRSHGRTPKAPRRQRHHRMQRRPIVRGLLYLLPQRISSRWSFRSGRACRRRHRLPIELPVFAKEYQLYAKGQLDYLLASGGDERDALFGVDGWEAVYSSV